MRIIRIVECLFGPEVTSRQGDRMRRMFAPLGGTAISVLCMIAATSALCQNNERPAKASSEVEHCQGAKEAAKDVTKDERAPARCREEGNSKAPASASQQQPTEAGTWQLARTRNPAGGPDTISMTKILDGTQSDQDVTGLMLRCSEGAIIDVLVVLIAPLPLQTHPKVTVVAGSTSTDFIASVGARSFGAKRFGAAAGESIRAGGACLAVRPRP
jgi:hypothetical protein